MPVKRDSTFAQKLLPGCLVASILFSVSIVLGNHIHVESPYDGRMTDNYITPYSPRDLLLFLLLTAVCYIITAAVRMAVKKRGLGIRYEGAVVRKRDSVLRFLGLWILLFLSWLPYLLRYRPGFIFPDSVNSIQQALKQIPLNNRNPLLFTLSLRFCFFVTETLTEKDITAGCVLFSLLQAGLMAASFSYLILWCRERLQLRKILLLLLLLLFVINPYLAADSVAMWKDPLFAAALVLWSLHLTDFAIAEHLAKKRSWRVIFLLLGLFLLFWRNNGITAVLAVTIYLAVRSFHSRKEKAVPAHRVFHLSLGIVCLWAFTIVFGYKIIGVGTPKEESAGLMINQMARVVAYEGDLSEEDRAFMDELLPLETYRETYRPCCVDQLKWDARFNYNALRGNRIMKTWLSMLVKNPRLYFEAWELETYGFWTVNRPEILFACRNISSGNPYNRAEEGFVSVEDKIIRFDPVLRASFWEMLLPTDSWSVPLGIVNWFLVLAGISFTACKKPDLLLLLLPSMGVAAGMILASPIWYLARYGAGAQFLLPVILLVLLIPDEKEEPAAVKT